MNKKLLIIIGGVIIIIVVAYVLRYLISLNGFTGDSVIDRHSKMSLSTLLASSVSQKCTFTNKTDTSESSGTVYVSGGKMRGDFKTVASGRTMQSHMIVDGQTSYMWSDEMPQGFKMDFADMQKQDTKNQTVDVNQQLDYSCGSWSADASAFVTPAGIEFKDMQAMMQGMMPKTNTGTIQNSGYSDVKKMQCAACDNAPTAEAKAQCKTALGCS